MSRLHTYIASNGPIRLGIVLAPNKRDAETQAIAMYTIPQSDWDHMSDDARALHGKVALPPGTKPTIQRVLR